MPPDVVNATSFAIFVKQLNLVALKIFALSVQFICLSVCLSV